MRFQLINAIAGFTLTATSNAIPTIYAKGSKFFTSEGEQWYIKGVAYQPTGNDPLADPVQCALDAPLMQKLGANAIRIYHADPYANHDACMATFAAAGIYVFADLDTYSTALVESLTPVWTATQFANFSRVMDAFSTYSNMAGFIIGNEVLNIPGPLTVTAPYIKAATADMKAYRDSKGYRSIPVGYAHADVGGLRPALPEYLACGSDFTQSIDFFALNSYLFCGNMTYPQSGYMALYEQTQNYTVPIFMSETGCNVPEPRYWLDENSLFGPMADVWSGAIIYDWVQQDNHYGIITYGGGNTDALDYNAPPGGFLASGTPTPITPDFSNLLNVWATNTPTGIVAAAYTPPMTTLACPAYTAGVWEVNGNPLPLPTLGVSALRPLVTTTDSTASLPILSTTNVVTASLATSSTSYLAGLSVSSAPVATLGAAAAFSANTPSAFGANAIIASTSISAVSESYSLVVSSMIMTTATSSVDAVTGPSSATTSTMLSSPVPASSLSSSTDISSPTSTVTVLSTSTTVASSSGPTTDQSTSVSFPPYSSNNTTTVDTGSSRTSIASTTTSITSTTISSTSDGGYSSSAVISSTITLSSTSTISNGISSDTIAPALVTTSLSSTLISTTTLTSSGVSVNSAPQSSTSPNSMISVSGQTSTITVQPTSSMIYSTTMASVSRSTVVVAPSAAASTSRAAATGSSATTHADGSLSLLCGGLVLGLAYLGV